MPHVHLFILIILSSSVHPSFICSSFFHLSSFFHMFILFSSVHPSFICSSFFHLFILPSSVHPFFICSSFFHLFIIPSSVHPFSSIILFHLFILLSSVLPSFISSVEPTVFCGLRNLGFYEPSRGIYCGIRLFSAEFVFFPRTLTSFNRTTEKMTS